MEGDPGPTLRSSGEDAVIERLTASRPLHSGVLTGPGDDCAVLRPPAPDHLVLLKTDCVIEGVHFLPGTDPGRVGWKAAARVVSDFAAMGGGQPLHALVTLIAPPDRPLAWAESVYAGIHRCGERFGFSVVGGETSRPPDTCESAILSVCMSGTIPPASCRLRSGARTGDSIWVTGTLGGSLDSGKHLDFLPRMDEARWLAAFLPVTALMDLSDGLARDLPRLAARSGTGYRLDQDAVPRTPGSTLEAALTDGEDYELLFTLERPPSPAEETQWNAAFPGLPLTCIGQIVPPDARPSAQTTGWDAFRP